MRRGEVRGGSLARKNFFFGFWCGLVIFALVGLPSFERVCPSFANDIGNKEWNVQRINVNSNDATMQRLDQHSTAKIRVNELSVALLTSIKKYNFRHA